MSAAIRDGKATLDAQLQLLAAGAAAIRESQSLVIPVAYPVLRARADAWGAGPDCDRTFLQALTRRLMTCESARSAILVGKTIIECIRYRIANADAIVECFAAIIVSHAPSAGFIWDVVTAVVMAVDSSVSAQLALSSAIIETGFSHDFPGTTLVLLSNLPHPTTINVELPGKAAGQISPLTMAPSNAPRGMRPVLSQVRRRANNTIALKSTAGLLKPCAGTRSACGELTQNLVSTSRDIAIWTHYNLLVERAPLSAMHVDVEYDPVLKRRCVCGAVVLRVLTLASSPKIKIFDQHDHPMLAPASFSMHTPIPTTPLSAGLQSMFQPGSSTSSADDVRPARSVLHEWKESWGEWLLLADQFNSLLVAGLVEFEEFLLMLVHSGKSYFGGSPLRSNAVVWLITQVMPLDVVKTAIANSFSKSAASPNSSLADNIIGMYDSRCHSTENISELLNASIACMVWRLRSIRKDFSSAALDGLNIEHIHETYGAWWKQTVSSPGNTDFFNLDEASCIKVAIVSNISSQVVSDRLIQFLNDEPTDSKLGWQTLPGQLVFSGHTKPLATSFLVNLNAQCRNRIAQMLQDRLFSGGNSKSSANLAPPGLVETYVRLLYIAPYSLRSNLKKLCFLLENRPPLLPAFQLHTLMEMINYRLFRLFSHQGLLASAFQATISSLTRTTGHPLLVDSAHSLLLKIALTIALPVGSISEQAVRLPVVINRAALLGAAWHWTDASCEGSCQQILESYWKVCPRSFSPSTLHWMPHAMRAFFQTRESQIPTITWSEVQAQARRPDYASLLDFRPKIDDVSMHLSSHAGARQQLYCVAALLWLQNPTNFETYEYNFQMVVSRIETMEVPDAVVAFTQFMFDALDGGRIASASSDWSPVETLTNLLVQFAWRFRLVPVDMLVLALCDHDTHAEIFPILRALLLGLGDSDAFGPRIEALTGCEPGVELLPHWDDPDYLSRHIDYYTSFPESSVGAGYESLLNPSDDIMLPIYYGNSCFRMLPVLDVVLARLIENNQTALLVDVANLFQPLYPVYHRRPLSTVLWLFRYFDGAAALDSDVRRALLRLAVGPPFLDDSMFSPAFLCWARQSVSDFSEPDLFTPNYCRNLLHRLAGKITIVSLSSSVGERSAQFFYEFRSDYDQVLSVSCLETITLPVDSRTLIKGFVDFLLNYFENGADNSSIKVMQAFALIVAQLPLRFHNDLVRILIASIATQALVIDELSPFAANFIESDWKSMANSLMGNAHCLLLSVIHHIFEQIRSLLVTFISYLPHFSADVVGIPIRLLFVCRSFIPFLTPSFQPFSAVFAALKFVLRSLNGAQGCFDSPYVEVVLDWLSSELPSLLAVLDSQGLAELRLLVRDFPECCPKRIISSYR